MNIIDKELNVYCDESCHISGDGHNSLLVAALSCPKENIKDITAQIKEVKQRHNLSPKFEIKWTNVSNFKLQFFKDIFELFFKSRFLNIIIIKIPNKDNVTNGQLWLNEHIYFDIYRKLLDNSIVDDNKYMKYNVYMDFKDYQWASRIKKLTSDIKYRLAKDLRKNSTINMNIINSKESLLIQICDLLMGCVGYEERFRENIKNIANFLPNGAKQVLLRYLRKKLRVHSFDKTINGHKFHSIIWKQDVY